MNAPQDHILPRKARGRDDNAIAPAYNASLNSFVRIQQLSVQRSSSRSITHEQRGSKEPPQNPQFSSTELDLLIEDEESSVRRAGAFTEGAPIYPQPLMPRESSMHVEGGPRSKRPNNRHKKKHHRVQRLFADLSRTLPAKGGNRNNSVTATSAEGSTEQLLATIRDTPRDSPEQLNETLNTLQSP